MQDSWALERGAQLRPDNSVHFSVWAPHARDAFVRVLSGPARGDHRLHREGQCDVLAVAIPDVGPDADYAFLIDGDALPDPVSRWQPNGVHAPSRVVDPSDFTWTDDGWRGVARESLVIYELHVGTFTPEGTFAAAIPRLGELADLGVTAIEIMPVAQFPGARNWGYDGVDLYAVQNSYGGPHELRRFVDAAHAAGLAVILDVVYNHVGPEGNYLERFGPYFTDKYRTPWGRALNFDDAHSDEVRRFIIDNARYWIAEYHIDGLRLDAVHGLFDFGPCHLLQDIASAVHELGARFGRRTLVIGESDLNDPKLLRAPAEHGYGLDGQWSDDFHHAVHAVLTGETNGYYADYGGVERVAAVLREPFLYSGQYSSHRRRRHGAPSTGLPRGAFVVATQNHDQVGNRAAGERLSVLVDPPRLRLAAAMLLLSPYVPLIFMGEEYGETNPFQYFVDHGDTGLVQAVREGRRREFESFDWSRNVPDPACPETFERSRLDWSRATQPGHREFRALFRDLLELRCAVAELRPAATPPRVASGEPGWIAVERPTTLALFNCSNHPARISLPDGRAWTVRLSTDAPGYAGTAESAVQLASDAADLPAWTAVLLMSENN